MCTIHGHYSVCDSFLSQSTIFTLTDTLTMISRDDISTLLAKLGSQITVTLLLESLQHSLEFEAFASRKYQMPVSTVTRVYQKYLQLNR